MRLNGLVVVAELAARAVADPRVDRYKAALVLGSLREDVWWVPGAEAVVEHLSFSHFYEPGAPGGFVPWLWPGPRMKARTFFRRALRAERDGRRAAAFVQLGRVLHLLTDMACPTHAHRAVHDTDPYEWWVEAHAAELLERPVPIVGAVTRVEDAIEAMAQASGPHRPDRTNHAAGRVLRRIGLRTPVTPREAGEQARALVPLAGAWGAAVLRLFLDAAPDR